MTKLYYNQYFVGIDAGEKESKYIWNSDWSKCSVKFIFMI